MLETVGRQMRVPEGAEDMARTRLMRYIAEVVSNANIKYVKTWPLITEERDGATIIFGFTMDVER